MTALMLAIAIVAAPWPAPVIPAASSPAGTGEPDRARTGAPPLPEPSSRTVTTERPIPVTVGIASWMPERYGPDYLALPGGAGTTVRICGVRCLLITSNDAGPSLGMQRRGRVADLAVIAWEWVTDLPRSRGLARVVVDYSPALDGRDTVTPV